MFWTRLASGVILAPLFLALVYFGFPYFNLLVAAIAGVMVWEFARMDAKAGQKRQALMMVAALAAVAAMSLSQPPIAFAIIALATLAVIAADQMAGRRGINILQTAVVYVGLPAVCLIYVMQMGGYLSVFWLLAVVWGTDIGAYAFGRIIGGPKLMPRVSPKKTWSGAVGGLAVAIVASAILLWAFDRPFVLPLALLAGLTSIVSQAGDLFESALKRRYDVKDSGALIPGHGGVMDRFDGLWGAAPVVALACAILNGGVQEW